MGYDWQPGELAERYGPAVYRLAYARTGSRADAEDVMQEVFLRLLKARPAFEDDGHCRAWLLRVAANCANDIFRSPWRGRMVALEEDVPAPEAPMMIMPITRLRLAVFVPTPSLPFLFICR